MKKLLIVMMVAMATACSNETAEPHANLGEKIEASYAKAVVLQEGVSVKVTKIEDSRCPKNVVCVWAGMVKVYFSITENNVTKEASVELYTDKEPKTTVELNGTTYSIEVTEVSPYPATPDPISLEDYRISFTIKKV